MDFAPVIPWLFGFVGFGVGLLVVGNDPWLFAFGYVPVAVGYLLLWEGF